MKHFPDIEEGVPMPASLYPRAARSGPEFLTGFREFAQRLAAESKRRTGNELPGNQGFSQVARQQEKGSE